VRRASDGTIKEAAAMETGANAAGGQGQKLLLIDDDAPLRRNMARALEKEGFNVAVAASLKEAYEVASEFQPDHAVVDLNLSDGHGMELIGGLQEVRPGIRVLVMTGYDSIASSLVALRAGAVGYLPKPAQAKDIVAALTGTAPEVVDPGDQPMSADRIRWEHIQRVFEQCDRNVSETARRLSMHRRTLQRILAKRAPRP
jgi:two-component system response regulator RegA